MSLKWPKVFVVVFAAVAMTGCLRQSIGKSTGAFLHPVNGPDFVHISNDSWDPSKHALIYFYRPDSQWAADEIEAPSVYVDDHHYFNIRGNSHTWLEVLPGHRVIAYRRPFLGIEGLLDGIAYQMGHLDNKKVVQEVELDVKPGQVYYLRYNELTPPSEKNPELDADSPLAKGNMQLVTREYAMSEITKTKFLVSDMLAPNHAAASIVEDNWNADVERKTEELEAMKAEEYAKLKADGHWREPKWYWPFGGGPTKRTKAESELKKLEKQKETHLASLEAQKPEKSFWPF
ncbi:MAG: DUF2846 domain-containing protein [Hahellaceae bacterium]|nr:DUF2846 domain-containing protein [Hahellaceae bacterium]